MIPTREQAWDLLCEYNEGEFHRLHARIVGDVMRYFAAQLGYADEADFWQTVGILHDLDFEQYPDQHCTKEAEILRETRRGRAPCPCGRQPRLSAHRRRAAGAPDGKGALRHGRADRPYRRGRADAADEERAGSAAQVRSKRSSRIRNLPQAARARSSSAARICSAGALDELMERTIAAMQASPAANGN